MKPLCDPAPEEAELQETGGFKARKVCGVHWPDDIYEAITKRKPPARLRTVINFNGQKVLIPKLRQKQSLPSYTHPWPH